MDSATRTVSSVTKMVKKSKRFGMKSFLKTLLLLGIILNVSSAFAQKTLNPAELQQDLNEVTTKLQEVEEKIAHINFRLAEASASNISPELQQKLNDLDIKKNQYQREKISIEAALNSIQSTNGTNDSSQSQEMLDDHPDQFFDQNNHTTNQ